MLAAYVSVVIFAIQIVKLKDKENPNQISQNSLAATIHQRYNKELFSLLFASIVTASMIGLAFLTGYTDKVVSTEKAKLLAFLNEDLIHPLFFLVIYPTFVYVQNCDLRQHLSEMFLDLIG